MFEQVENAQIARSSPSLRLSSVHGATVAAAASTLAVFLSSPEQPLPPKLEAAAFAFWGMLAFLFLAVRQDLAHNKIPNRLTFPAFGIALLLAAWSGGGPGLIQGVLGAGAAFAILVVPFAARAVAAGDVKALMVLGALGGPLVALNLIFWSTIVSGLLAIAVLTAKGGIRPLLERWNTSLGATLATQKATYLKPAAGEAAALALPRSLALALGIAGYNLWGVPWA